MFLHRTYYPFLRYGKKYTLKKGKEFIANEIYSLTFSTLYISTYNTLISY